LWQISRGLLAVGATALAAGMLFAGVRLVHAYTLRGKIQADQAQFRVLSAEYARVTAKFPATPTSTANLKTTIKLYDRLQQETATPAYLYEQISKALAGFPRVEIEDIDWRVGKPPAQAPVKGAAARPVAAAAAAPNADYALAVVSARVVGARRTDLRSITDMAEQFIATLKKNPKLTVMGAHMPFAITAEDTLSGDIGSSRAIAEDASFKVTVGRRLGR
jgi:TfoX/Sxy family transcriptional regulator of competence genes